MTVSPEALAAAMRKYEPESSAALDPFEEPPVDMDDAVAIHSWLQHVEEVMSTHRSPFIAAEVVLSEIDEYARGNLHQPERLLVATALPVLQHCLPALTPEHREVIRAAVRELVPAMAFTRVQPALLSPTGIDTVRRVPYAECFWRVYEIFAKHKRTIAVGARRSEVEAAVMDRVVLSLDRLWVKMFFLSWKVYCRQIREKKQIFRKLARRGMAGHIVPQYIRAWRRHAHAVMLGAKIARSSEVARELEALYPQEQHAKSLNERTHEEVREKVRLLELETARCEQAGAKLDVLRVLHHQCEESLQEHWDAWQACVTALFGDSHPINKALEEDYSNAVTYDQNITDTAQLYAKRARARTGQVGLKQIQACLRSQGYLSDADGIVEAGEATATSASGGAVVAVKGPGPALGGGTASWVGTRATTKYVKVPTPMATVDATIQALQAACDPTVSPLRVMDLVRGNQARLNVVLSFLSCMYSGGHCSLYWPPRAALKASAEPEPAEPSSTGSPTLRGGSATAVKSTGLPVELATATLSTPEKGDGEPPLDRADGARGIHHVKVPASAPPAGMGARMIRDVADGVARAQVCCAGSDRYLLSIRRCMESNAVDGVQEYLGCLFTRFSTMGLPLNRGKVECALATLVRPADTPIIHALYPTKGINTFTEFSEYLTKIAEFSSHSLLSIGERLENDYPWSPQEELLYVLNTSNDIQQLLRDSHDYVSRLVAWTTDEQHPERLSRDRVMTLLRSKLGLSEELAEEVWAHAGSEADTVGKEDTAMLLYLAAAYLDPSPFTPPAEKIAVVLDRCIPFLLGL